MRSPVVSIRLLWLVVFATVVVQLAACTPVPPSPSDIIGRIQYLQDRRTGLCFATITSTPSNNNGIFVTSITEVPCEKVEKFLVQ